jgi:hypothetical protein
VADIGKEDVQLDDVAHLAAGRFNKELHALERRNALGVRVSGTHELVVAVLADHAGDDHQLVDHEAVRPVALGRLGDFGDDDAAALAADGFKHWDSRDKRSRVKVGYYQREEETIK